MPKDLTRNPLEANPIGVFTALKEMYYFEGEARVTQLLLEESIDSEEVKLLILQRSQYEYQARGIRQALVLAFGQETFDVLCESFKEDVFAYFAEKAAECSKPLPDSPKKLTELN